MNNKNILIIAAHPDDEVLGVGGTIPLLKEKGYRIITLIVTDGSSTQYKRDDVILSKKMKEAEAANSILHVDELIHWNYPDMRLDTIEHHELNNAFEDVIASKSISTVFVHNETDINLDHELVYKALMVAARPHPEQIVKRIFSYFVCSSTEWGGRNQNQVFVPNTFIDINSTIDIKLKAMEAYQSELRSFPHPRSIEAIRKRASVHGIEVGMTFAEPFKLILNTSFFI